MEEYNNKEEIQNDDLLDNEEEEGLSFSDKLVGVFTEPIATFTEMAKHPPKALDWLIPLVLIVVLAIGAQYLIFNQPALQNELIDKIEQQTNEAVEAGQLTQNQANQRLDFIRSNPDTALSMQFIISSIAIPVVSIIFLLIFAAVLMAISKFILKGEGNYAGALVATGFPMYVLLINSLLIIIMMLVTQHIYRDVSLASFLSLEKTTLLGFITSRIDLFSIWYYTLVGIGLSKFFKAENCKKYVIAIISLWLGFTTLVFIISQFVPFVGQFLG